MWVYTYICVIRAHRKCGEDLIFVHADKKGKNIILSMWIRKEMVHLKPYYHMQYARVYRFFFSSSFSTKWSILNETVENSEMLNI